LKVGTENGAFLSMGALWGEPGGRILSWGPWRLCRKGSGDGNLSPQGSCWGTWKGAHLPGTLRNGWRGLQGWSVS